MELSDGVWPDRLPAVEVRIARPTDNLGEVLDFYCGDLGLPELYRTAAHGYQVVMVGLPGDKYHLEFTSHADGSPCPAPSVDVPGRVPPRPPPPSAPPPPRPPPGPVPPPSPPAPMPDWDDPIPGGDEPRPLGGR